MCWAHTQTHRGGPYIYILYRLSNTIKIGFHFFKLKPNRRHLPWFIFQCMRAYEYTLFFVCRCGLGFGLCFRDILYILPNCTVATPFSWLSISNYLYLYLYLLLHLCLHVCKSYILFVLIFPLFTALHQRIDHTQIQVESATLFDTTYAIKTLLSGVKSFRINVKPLRSYIVFPFEVHIFCFFFCFSSLLLHCAQTHSYILSIELYESILNLSHMLTIFAVHPYQTPDDYR